MKSKTHHKKCFELGITPIPTMIPNDIYISAHGGQSPGLEEPDLSSLNGQSGPKPMDEDSDSEDMEEDEHLLKEYYKHSEKDERKIQSFYDTVKYINRILAEENSKANNVVLTFQDLWQRGLESTSSIKIECLSLIHI